jgi:glyoxylase-like metal-dependent hydrolase (beta-lactamase superfamily II)
MAAFICRQCGTQYADSSKPPPSCPVCEDDRQFVRWEGQSWLTLDELGRSHKMEWEVDDFSVAALQVAPHFAIGQRALLVGTEHGNILWDCVALIDQATIERIRAHGGLSAIAISHPHFYTTMIEWSDAFGGIPIYVHADDRDWVRRSSNAIVHWSGETFQIAPQVTLIRCGGHFPGAAIMHWAGWNGGTGAIFTGDTLQVAMDRRHVSFMYSFPNIVPLDARTVGRIGAAVAPLQFDCVYGGFFRRTIAANGKVAVARSVQRYLDRIK